MMETCSVLSLQSAVGSSGKLDARSRKLEGVFSYQSAVSRSLVGREKPEVRSDES